MLEEWYQSLATIVITLGSLGVFIILLFAVFHVTFEGPLALFLMTTLAILFDSVPLAVATLLIVHIIGLPIFYYLVHSINRWSRHAVDKAKLTKSLLDWVEHQPDWKHMIVVGLPFVYTYPIKVAFTLRAKSFWQYIKVLVGSYFFLYVGNLLIYYGILSFFNDQISPIISFALMTGVALVIYFGRQWLQQIIHPSR